LTTWEPGHARPTAAVRGAAACRHGRPCQARRRVAQAYPTRPITLNAGAGGTTATARGAQAAADGYTIIAGSMGTHAAAATQYANLKYDPARDFTPIGLTAEAPAVIVTRKDFPANTLKEFVAYVRQNQAKVNEAHAGVGSQMHTYCTLLHAIMGTKTARIAYRGGTCHQ
jgi:tripartite-type tricarboxylate transporter receptor subunit TctC